MDVKKLYDTYKTPTRTYVAYKGGTLEKDLLDRLNIPCWNLEEAGCPKFERLARLGTVSSFYVTIALVSSVIILYSGYVVTS